MAEKKRGSLIVFSGCSGAGKGTILDLVTEHNKQFVISISCTTRSPREGEKDGVNYFFITQEEFDRKIEEDQFLEYARYVNKSYGTPRAFVDAMRDEGRDVILEIEAQGAMIVKEKCPDAIMIFMMPPSASELERRLRGRKTEKEEVIRGRLAQAEKEISMAERYDAVIVNDTRIQAAHDFVSAVEILKKTPVRQKSFLDSFRNDLKEINTRNT